MTAMLRGDQLCIFNHRVARLHCKAVPQTTPSNIRSGIIISHKNTLLLYFTINIQHKVINYAHALTSLLNQFLTFI